VWKGVCAVLCADYQGHDLIRGSWLGCLCACWRCSAHVLTPRRSYRPVEDHVAPAGSVYNPGVKNTMSREELVSVPVLGPE
jgi:hypothetical protein